MTDWTSLTYVVIDVEGNGQQPPDIVELAAVPIVDGIIGEPACWLVKPETPISPIARRIHGITNSAVVTAPRFADIEAEVREALAADAVVAHNAHVDLGVLRRKLCGWDSPEIFDTLRLARRLLPGAASYKLGALVEELRLAQGLSNGLAPHRASYDALVTARLFVNLANPPDARARSLDQLRDRTGRGGDDGTATLF